MVYVRIPIQIPIIMDPAGEDGEIERQIARIRAGQIVRGAEILCVVADNLVVYQKCLSPTLEIL